MLRLFFALQPTVEQGAELLADFERRFAPHGLVAIPAGNVHATLCFLGAVDAARLPELRAAAARVHGRKLSLRFDALEYWDRPQIVCATASPAGVLGADLLARAIADEVIATGFSPDIKPFRAHLTLARKVRRDQAEKLALPQPLEPALVVRCDEFVLMQSSRGENGSVYTAIDHWQLEGD